LITGHICKNKTILDLNLCIFDLYLFILFNLCYTFYQYNLSYYFLHHIFYKDTMTDLPTYIQNSLSLLEGYVFASDKSQYLQEKVTLSQDKRFFDLLLNPIDTT